MSEEEVETPTLKIMEFGLEGRTTEELGLEGVFNTFRIGLRWAGLEPGEGIELLADGETAGRARVLATAQGTLGDMLELHAGSHHACRQPMPADRRAELRGVLTTAYGRPVTDGDKCVVVYMMAEPGPEED